MFDFIPTGRELHDRKISEKFLFKMWDKYVILKQIKSTESVTSPPTSMDGYW